MGKYRPVAKESLNLIKEKIEFLKKEFPEAVSEGKIDFEKLKLVLDTELVQGDEKYAFNWAGRKDSFRNIQTTAKGTLKPEKSESVNWDSTENLFIEGDNLEVLKLLQRAYFNKIKMIYIDPPYNTGGDFVYKDDFNQSIKSYLKQTGQANGDSIRLTTNPETNGRYHSDWISMMYPRLFIARNLLREDGLIFVSIDDNEAHNLKIAMNEIFGEENFVDTICWKKKYGGGAKEKYLVSVHEYILVYAKDKNVLPEITVEFDLEKARKFYKYKDDKFDKLGYYRTHPLEAVKSFDIRENLRFPIKAPDGSEVYPQRQWRWGKERFKEALAKDEIIFSKNKKGEWTLSSKQYLNDESGEQRKTKFQSVIDDIYTQEGTRETLEIFGDAKVFPFPKPIRLLKKLIEIGNVGPGEIILDFFAGSGTTAQAIFELNKEEMDKKFICVQLQEQTDIKSEAFKAGYKTIAEIAKERIQRVIKKIEQEQKENSKQKKLAKDEGKKPDLGFKVFRLDKSNYKIWEKYEGQNAKELKKQLELFKTSLASGYNKEDVIYECIIKEGYSLNSQIKNTSIKSNKVYKITDGDSHFYISLDSEIKEKTIDELKLKKEDVFICLDEALDDSMKKNLSIQCNLKVI